MFRSPSSHHRPFTRGLGAGSRGRAVRAVLAIAMMAVLPGCGAKAAPTSPPCDEKCRDGVALRSLRELLKFAFNSTLAGNDAGAQDGTARISTGTVRVFGEATSNAAQGLTKVNLTYEISHCPLAHVDNTPDENYDMVFDGTITQEGTIAVQPSAPTALSMRSEGITLSGKVYDPPLPFDEAICAVDVTQNGNNVSGKFCGRDAGFDF